MLWSYEKDEGNDKAEKCVARYAASLAMHIRYNFYPINLGVYNPYGEAKGGVDKDYNR